jgi:hypothetical protein
MAEQNSRAINELTVNVDVSEGIKNLKRLQREIRDTLQLIKELESVAGKLKLPIWQTANVNSGLTQNEKRLIERAALYVADQIKQADLKGGR